MSTTTNFWELLQQRQDELTKSGRAVADYLVHHADEAQYLSISSLARECKVAEATVFRFCRALGFEGYHEMRISLAQANATGALVNQHEPEPGATTASLCEHASGLFLTAINGTQNSLSPEAVEQAVDLMRAARQVFCLGQGGSMLLANDICARFSSLSNKFRTAGDSHLQILAASLMGPEDVVLFISYSGATRDMLETLRTAKHPAQRSFCSPIMRIRPVQPWQMWCCGAARRRAHWIPAASPSRWRCFMWARCFCSAICWMTPSIPTKPRTAPARRWPSS